MDKQRSMPVVGKLALGAAGLGLASYATYVATTWTRYGAPVQDEGGGDDLMDLYMPHYEVCDRHETAVRAPADVTFAAACDGDFEGSVLIQALFKTRELIFGRAPVAPEVNGGFVDQVKALGWVVLAEVPGREIVFGAAARPWTADGGFRSIPPDEFASFSEPGFVKIIWNLRADPVDGTRSIARTETRVTTTDPIARARFRWYWSFLSPGIKLIRLVMLSQTKARAEADARLRDEAEVFQLGAL